MKLHTTLLPLAALTYAFVEQIPLQEAAPQPFTAKAIPLLGLGTWNIRENATAVVSEAIQLGYRHIDAAAIYGNEAEVGLGIADGLKKAGLKREDLWITSKLWNSNHARSLVEPALDETLAKLGVGYLDLYLIHWPVASSPSGNQLSYLETWSALEELQAAGKTRHIGIANFGPEMLKDLVKHSKTRPAVHQMEMHPYLQQNKFLKAHRKLGIHVTAYSPLAGTNPTYEPGTPTQLLQNKVLKKIADKRGCTPAQVALRWGMTRGTSVIPKTTHYLRLKENIWSVACDLTKGDLKKIDKLGETRFRYSNPSKGWGIDIFDGLEDAHGDHEKNS